MMLLFCNVCCRAPATSAAVAEMLGLWPTARQADGVQSQPKPRMHTTTAAGMTRVLRNQGVSNRSR
jgi:hypothetical protein